MKRSPVFGRLAALSDPIRARLLAALERNELTVGELHRALQLPQSTVSRHLRALADAGWVSSREDGTSNLYRMAPADRDASARKLWHAVRDDVAALAGARADAERVRRVLAERHGTSQKFFASGAGQWDRLRAELVGDRTELVALSALLDRSWTVADLGCGSGQLAEAVAPFVERVIGVDESATMLRAARAWPPRDRGFRAARPCRPSRAPRHRVAGVWRAAARRLGARRRVLIHVVHPRSPARHGHRTGALRGRADRVAVELLPSSPQPLPGVPYPAIR
jgi:DNA-binding transcriptional ArsR family regulator